MKRKILRVAFDRRLKLEFHGVRITSDGDLLACRELDDALALTATGTSTLPEGRRGRNINGCGTAEQWIKERRRQSDPPAPRPARR